MMLGIVTRRRYEADLAAAKAETNRQRERAEKAEDTASTETAARRTITRQHAELDAANKRLAGRNRALTEQLEATQVGSGFDRAKARLTAQRIARLQRAVARARAEASRAAVPDRDRARLVTELDLARRANRSLDEQTRTLQTANEALTKELHDVRQPEGSAS